MTKELYISVAEDKVRIALQENGVLLEIHEEPISIKFKVGDIFLGKVKKIANHLNATFVDIGYQKDAFLHYQDLGVHFKSFQKYTQLVGAKKKSTHLLKDFPFENPISKLGTINQIIKSGDSVMVQVTKEPISTKGPRITSEISIAGRYVVLVPFSNQIAVSQKIENEEERNRLKNIVSELKPIGFGVIIRTVAEEKNAIDIQDDIADLIDKWQKIFVQIQQNAKPPIILLNELDRASSILRDTFNGDFSKVLCDDKILTEEIKEYIKVISPEKIKVVKYYNNPQPLMEKYGVERQIKQMFGKTVNIGKGAYLIIEHTEALHVIDVNSGSIKAKENSQEKNAFDINVMAAKEIAKQLRLRDMGGIIVVDFIDMKDKDHRKSLFDLLKQEMSIDKAKHKILPPSSFGLIQITRQRVRPEMSFVTNEENPNEGNKVEAPILIINAIETEIKNISKTHPKQKIYLHAHPFVISYLKLGLLSIQRKWIIKHKIWLEMKPRDSFKYLEYQILDKRKNILNSHSN
jgi:ribonuclease G